MFSLIPLIKFDGEPTTLDKEASASTELSEEIVLPIPVFIDDNVSLIKDKLCLYISETKLMFPPFLRLSVEIRGKMFRLTNDQMSIVQLLDDVERERLTELGGPEGPDELGGLDGPGGLVELGGPRRSGELVLIVSNLIDELMKDSAESIYTAVSSGDLTKFIEYKKDYPKLREDYFTLALKIALYKINPIFYSSFEGDIESGMEDILSEMTKIGNFVSKAYEDLDDYIKLAKDIKLPIDSLEIIKDANIINANYSVELNKNIDIVKIFNTFELNEEIPFIGIGGQYINKKNPVVRLFKKENKTVISEREIKDFYVTENKKRGVVSYRKIKGIVFKIKIPESTNYTTLLINERGSISINMKPNKSRIFVQQLLYGSIRDLIIKLRGGINHIHFNLVNLSVNIETNFYIDIDQFSVVVKRPSINRFLIELKDILAKELISLLYKKEITINMRDNPYSKNSSIIGIMGISGMWRVLTIFNHIVILNRLTSNLTGKEVTSEPTEFLRDIKERSNIKKLKELGIKVKSTNCQKQRQPILLTETTKKISPKKGSYPLVHEGNTYICPLEEYPYPGFTNENIICCFKKDQRNKEAYLRNIGVTIVRKETDAKKHIITTEKLLEDGRLGVLPQVLRNGLEKTLGIKNLFRLGVLQDRNSLINALALDKDKTRFLDELRVFADKNKEFLKINGDITDNITRNPKIVLLVASYYTNLNYIVFDSEYLECSLQIVTDNDADYIVLLKRDMNWELIVEKEAVAEGKAVADGKVTEGKAIEGKDVIKKQFPVDHKLIKFMKEYYEATCKKVDYYPRNYPYKKLPYFRDLISKIVVQSQIINENRLVNFIQTESGALIPIREEMIKLGIPFRWLSETELPSLETQIAQLTNIDEPPIGILTGPAETEVVGVLSNTGVPIPVVHSKYSDYKGNLPIITSFMGDMNFFFDKNVNWTRTIDLPSIDDLKREFSDYLWDINEDLREDIITVVTDPKTSNKQKFLKLKEMIPQKYNRNELIMELIVENEFSNILNDSVPSKFVERHPTYTEDVIYEW